MAANDQKSLRLCLMMEGTSMLARDWDDIKATYIIPLLQGAAKAYQQRAECALVVYRTRAGCNSQDIVQTVGWTSDFSRVLAWMEAFQPRGGGSMEAAFAEGLAEAIYLFNLPSRCAVLHVVATLYTPPPGWRHQNCSASTCFSLLQATPTASPYPGLSQPNASLGYVMQTSRIV